MKKLTKLLVICALIITVSGCTNSELTSSPTTKPTPEIPESTTQSATCTLINTETNLKKEITFDAVQEMINQVKVKITYDNETLGIDSFETFSEEQKEQYKNNMLNNIGIEDTTYEGLDITFEFNKKLSVIITADLNRIDQDLLKQLGIDFDITNVSFYKVIEEMENRNATCKY